MWMHTKVGRCNPCWLQSACEVGRREFSTIGAVVPNEFRVQGRAVEECPSEASRACSPRVPCNELLGDRSFALRLILLLEMLVVPPATLLDDVGLITLPIA